jgi:hypothetical protein
MQKKREETLRQKEAEEAQFKEDEQRANKQAQLNNAVKANYKSEHKQKMNKRQQEMEEKKKWQKEQEKKNKAQLEELKRKGREQPMLGDRCKFSGFLTEI